MKWIVIIILVLALICRGLAMISAASTNPDTRSGAFIADIACIALLLLDGAVLIVWAVARLILS
jgi:hypothetical protein